jgi:hypothetical protein
MYLRPWEDLPVAGGLNQLVLSAFALGVVGMWAKGKMGMCQIKIIQLKATNVKVVSSAPGGLTDPWMTY